MTVSLDLLDEEALTRILVEPKNAITRQYEKLFEMDDVKLTYHEDAVKAIAKRSFERKTGARGLRAIMESVMMDAMFEVPSDMNVKECIITKEAVLGEEQPKLILNNDEVKLLPKRKKAKKKAEGEIA